MWRDEDNKTSEGSTDRAVKSGMDYRVVIDRRFGSTEGVGTLIPLEQWDCDVATSSCCVRSRLFEYRISELVQPGIHPDILRDDRSVRIRSLFIKIGVLGLIALLAGGSSFFL